MIDSLNRFREELKGDSRDEARAIVHRRALLLFEFDSGLLGAPADSVDAVIAWRPPARLPCTTPGFAGVVQDRGRIVAVLESPLAAATTEARPVRRLIVCRTHRGFVGLPAETTRGVSVVEFAHEPSMGELVDSSEGPLAIVDPSWLLDERVSVGPSRVGGGDS